MGFKQKIKLYCILQISVILILLGTKNIRNYRIFKSTVGLCLKTFGCAHNLAKNELIFFRSLLQLQIARKH